MLKLVNACVSLALSVQRPSECPAGFIEQSQECQTCCQMSNLKWCRFSELEKCFNDGGWGTSWAIGEWGNCSNGEQTRGIHCISAHGGYCDSPIDDTMCSGATAFGKHSCQPKPNATHRGAPHNCGQRNNSVACGAAIKGCNVCDACCKPWITVQASCDGCFDAPAPNGCGGV
jgi:hypothetical protein